jgi:hypothetical protein
MRTVTPSLPRLLAAAAAFFVVGISSVARADEPPLPLLNEWWQWAMSIPSGVHPLLDNNGNRCALGQRGNLWFLTGNTGGKTDRQCSVPAGTRVLIPLHNGFCVPDAARTADQCYESVAQDYASFTSWSVELNGVPQAVIDQPPVPGESVFTFAVPRNGLFDYKAGLYRASIAAGRWSLVDLSAPGLYTLRVRSKSPRFALDVTYALAVAEVQ